MASGGRSKASEGSRGPGIDESPLLGYTQSQTNATSPPAPARPAMSNYGLPPQHPVTSQPTLSGRVFDMAKLTTTSMPIYHGMADFHTSGRRVQSAVQDAGSFMMQTLDVNSSAVKNNLTYEDLLHSLSHDGEHVLTDEWRLLYSRAVIYDCEVAANPPNIVQELGAGAAILTNKRLLLLSAAVGQALELTAFGEKKRARYYELSATNVDRVEYKPLPLRNIASVEMSASTGGRITSAIRPTPACCCGCCTCFHCCCASAMKQWFPRTGPVMSYNSRVIRIGLRLPPWDNRVMLHLEVAPEMPLTVARDFMVLLQRHSPISGSL